MWRCCGAATATWCRCRRWPPLESGSGFRCWRTRLGMHAGRGQWGDRVTHRSIAEAEHQRVMLAEHRPPRGQRDARPDPHPEEKAIVTAAPELADYVAGLKQRSRKVVTLALRQLLRLVREYPREPLLGAVREAGRYGLYDLDRLERMILRRVTREDFLIEGGSDDD